MNEELVFTIKKNEKDIKLKIKKPSLKAQEGATKAYNRAFQSALTSGALLREKLDDVAREQGLWDDAKEAEAATINKKLYKAEKTLAQGKIKLSAAKKIALQMRELRSDLTQLIAGKMSLDTNTAQGQADNARFNYMVSALVVYNDSEKPFFSDLEDYLNQASEEYAVTIAENFAKFMYGLGSAENAEGTLPENKFLHRFGFVNDELQLIDKDGRRVDGEGRLIDENGRFINEKGQFINIYGDPIDKDGNLIVEESPFLDDDGQPIIEEEEVEEIPPPQEEVAVESSD